MTSTYKLFDKIIILDHFISNYNQSQSIEIEVQDIQEIIIQDKTNEIEEQSKVILSNGQEYNIQDLEIADENAEPLNVHNENQPSNDEEFSIGINVVTEESKLEKNRPTVGDASVVLTTYGNARSEKILGSDQVRYVPLI